FSTSLATDAEIGARGWNRTLPIEAKPGAKLFTQAGCESCHTYRGTGSLNLGARDLTDEGSRHGRGYLAAYIADPERFGNRVMPRFGIQFTKAWIRSLAIFLADSRSGATKSG